MNTILAYLRLMRPANILTAIADILLGIAIAGGVGAGLQFHNLGHLFWLIMATAGLYGGGVVFNDVFDLEEDKTERPERPLPSGAASMSGAIVLGATLLFGGVWAAFQVSGTSGTIAAVLVALILLYDALSKHHSFWGPFNMGLCRGANLWLGISILPAQLGAWWFMGLIPVVYISAITLVSRGEVQGGSITALRWAFGMYGLVILSIPALDFFPNFQTIYSLPFLVLFAYLIYHPLLQAFRDLAPANIMRAVKGGVLALIVLDATLAAGFAGWVYGLAVLALLPLSFVLAKLFAVS
ncbi:MAG: UbiA-like protein EboC [Microscillaceae bacterium]|jgi:4-hydroxybenzoate polyprenyltransferase|nr:UbiA-like protein EboC [Microscillaceae bacterium]